MYEIKDDAMEVVVSETWSVTDVKYIEWYLEIEVELTDAERWEILKGVVEHCERMDDCITHDKIEDAVYEYIEEKGE